MKKLIPVLLSLSMSATAYAYDCPTSATVGGGYVPEICQTSPSSDLAADSATVVNVNKKEIDDASGVGAAIGAVTGGVVGNKVTGKKNKTLGTVLGAVAGGVAGHYGEKYLKKKTVREVEVRMPDGKTKTFEYEKEPEFNVGDEVIVSGKYIYRKIQ
ncbi:MAG: glycine zipper 2TM domain-containing protein [Methylophilaceae bacterium]